MAGMSVSGYNALFGSLNGSYNAMAGMSSVIGNYNQIKSGQYSQLMKAYVNKVGNKEALHAYRTTGTTVQSATEMAADSKGEKSSSSTDSAKSATKSRSSSWLDNNVGYTAKANAAANKTVSKYHNTFLDDHLSGYDSDGSKKTAGTTGSSVDTEV